MTKRLDIFVLQTHFWGHYQKSGVEPALCAAGSIT